MSKVIISRVFPLLEPLDQLSADIEMVIDEEIYLLEPETVKTLHYDISYTFRLSHSEFVKAFEE